MCNAASGSAPPSRFTRRLQHLSYPCISAVALRFAADNANELRQSHGVNLDDGVIVL